MKILLDNCVPRQFERQLPGQEVVHCSRLGWQKLANGALLAAAENAGFDLLITVDHGIQYQHNMTDRKISIMFLRVLRNDMPSLVPLAEGILREVGSLISGSIITIDS